MCEAVIISDLHLGSDNCQAKLLIEFLEGLRHEQPLPSRLILNGDVFDSIDFRRLRKRHWKVLSLIRTLSDQIEIIWILGNHDGPAEAVSPLLGVAVRDEFVLESGGRRILFLHGHVFDQFIDRYPLVTWVADCCYWILQQIDPSHRVARFAKRTSKTFLRCAEKIQTRARDYARRNRCDIVCCGHTHRPVDLSSDGPQYFNSGCWTEVPCAYLAVASGRVQLHHHIPPTQGAEQAKFAVFRELSSIEPWLQIRPAEAMHRCEETNGAVVPCPAENNAR